MKSDNATPVTDDDELAKVLDGMNGDATQTADSDAAPVAPAADAGSLQFEESTTAPAVAPEPVATVTPEPTFEAAPMPAGVSGDLESIKKDALAELRPLVDKLELPADEKFDTLLLIIRSTDDQSLVSAAHDAARAIEDDGKRASALLDVIKEIDFFANQSK